MNTKQCSSSIVLFYCLLCVLSLCGLTFGSLAYADSVQTAPIKNRWHPVIGVGGGASSTIDLGQSKIFPLINPLTDEFYNYSPTNRTQTQGMFEIFLGAEHSVFSSLLLQAGLVYSQMGTFQSKGNFVQGADLQSANQYSYAFNAVTRQLLAQAKLMRPYHDKFYPYALLGLGSSFNTASNYSTNAPPFLTFTRNYFNNTSSTFAYRVGLGVDIDVTPHARLGIAYRLSNLGGVSLGAASINQQNVSGTLSQSNLYSNEVLFQLTYIM